MNLMKGGEQLRSRMLISKSFYFRDRILLMVLLPETSWEIKTTSQKGRGIFTKKGVKPGTVIGDYIGKVLRTAEEDTSEKDGLYLMYYHDYASILPEDVTAPGIHLLNHSCAPNCWIYTYQGHTLFFTLRKIFPGEELTASYLLSPDKDCEPCAHVCRCGHSFCTQTMHQTQERFERWDLFMNAEAKKTKRKRIHYGKTLPLLPSYPDSIRDHQIYDLFGSLEQPSLTQTNVILPTVEAIRKHIRQTGRILVFPKLKTRILGIKDNTFVMERFAD